MKRWIKQTAFLLAVGMLVACNAIWMSACAQSQQQTQQHSFTQWSAGEATCTESGIQTRYCTICGLSEQKTVPPLGHHYELSDTVLATCEAQGYNEFCCTRCGDTYRADLTDALPHTPVHVRDEAPTCTSVGWEIWECKVCGKETARIEIPALGHAYRDGVCVRCDTPATPELQYEPCAGGYRVVGLSAPVARAEIRAYYMGMPVIEIAPEAFADQTELQEVILPDTVRTIGADAWRGCTGLRALDIPDSVTEIGSGILQDCVALDTLSVPFLGSSPDMPAALHTLFGRAKPIDEPSAQYPSPACVTVRGGTIPKGAFSQERIDRIVLGEQVTDIATMAIRDCQIREIHILSPDARCASMICLNEQPLTFYLSRDVALDTWQPDWNINAYDYMELPYFYL